MMKNKTRKLFTAALCAMMLFAGCTAASALSLEEAQDIALDTAGVTDAVVFTEGRLDADDGVYEIAFLAGGVEYEFEVDAKTGAIRERDRDGIRRAAATEAAASAETVPTNPNQKECPWGADCPNGGDCPYDGDCEGDQNRHHGEGSGPEASGNVGRVSGREAKRIACAHASIREEDARDWDCEWDDGHWEISFEAGGIEYDYDIAADGTILRAETEPDR